MHRTNLLEKLYAYAPTASEEIVYKNFIIDFVKNHTDCFERTLEIGHITSSCWLLNKDGSKCLLMHHAKLNKWFQLGGHCDGDTDVMAVSIKEAQEESGINNIKVISTNIFDIDVHLIPARKNEKAHYHYDIRFLLQTLDTDDFVINHESSALKWFDKNPNNFPTDSLSVMRMFNKWSNIADHKMKNKNYSRSEY